MRLVLGLEDPELLGAENNNLSFLLRTVSLESFEGEDAAPDLVVILEVGLLDVQVVLIRQLLSDVLVVIVILLVLVPLFHDSVGELVEVMREFLGVKVEGNRKETWDISRRVVI